MFCIWSRRKFNRIDVLKPFCLWLIFSLLLVRGPWARKMSQDPYISLAINVSVYFRKPLSLLLFVFLSFLKQERPFGLQSYGCVWRRATLGSVNLSKIIRGIYIWGLGKLTDLKIREVKSLLISYKIKMSWLYPLNGFRIFFYCIRTAWQYKPIIVLLESTYISFFDLKCKIIRYMGFILK